MLMKDGKLDEALQCFDRAIALNPDNVAVINNRAIVLQALNRHEESLEALDEGLLVDPVSHKLLTNRGTALRALERRSEAMDSYDLALASKSDSPETLNNRGALLEDLCRYDEALEQYAKAIAVQPDFAKAHFNAGMCRLRLGDFEAGWKHTSGAGRPMTFPPREETIPDRFGWEPRTLPARQSCCTRSRVWETPFSSAATRPNYPDQEQLSYWRCSPR